MHQFKFEEEPFKRIVNIFKRILLASYSHSDLDALQNVIIFANSYYCPKYSLTGKKKTVLE